MAIAIFGQSRLDWLRKYVPLENGAPSHDTISRVLAAIDAAQFEILFARWTAQIQNKTAGEVVAIDGKILRRSFEKLLWRAAIHMVSAWASANGIVLGQVKVDSKSNEITAIPRLLDMLDVKKRIVTVDAMGTKKEITEKIIDKKGDYLMALRDNHPNLAADVAALFDRNLANRFLDGAADTIPHSYFQTVEKDHGRIETRRCWASSVLDDIAGAA